MLNQCNFIGRLGKDPDIKYTQSGESVCNFSLACSESWKDKNGEKKEKTEWVNIVIWGKLAGIAGEYLSKGSLCYISGKFSTRKWQDQSGNDRYTTEIIAREMKMLDGKAKGEGQQDKGQQGGYTAPPSMGEDVPF